MAGQPQAAVTEVRRAKPVDRELLGATLTAAFAEDPVFSWLVPPGAPARQARLQALFTALAGSYLAKEHCYLAAGGEAVALWAPPGRWSTPVSDILANIAPMLGSLRFRALHGLRSLTAVEGAHPKEPEHWYLGFLGTMPARQGQGLGAQLLQEVLVGADRDGVPAYLESSNPRNLSLYRRHGFEVVEQLSMPWGCPPVWRMWRDAAR